MNTRNPIIATLFAAGLLAGIPVAMAQMPGQAPLDFDQLDRNGDQSVDRDEYLAGKRSRMPDFSFADNDGNGFLSREEMATMLQAMRKKRQGSGQGRMGGTPPTFSDFDRDGNGILTESEFIEARGERIRQRAEQGKPMRGTKNIMEFSGIDRNGDGGVTADEFAAALQRHRMQHR